MSIVKIFKFCLINSQKPKYVEQADAFLLEK